MSDDDVINKISELSSSNPRKKKLRHKKDVTISTSVTAVADTLSQEEKIRELQGEIEELKSGSLSNRTLLVMPVSGKEVEFVEEEVDPTLCDVSDRNRRNQSLLTLQSVSDIFPSIRDTQQNRPGLGRRRSDGRIEVIGGSRRLFCVSQIPDRKFRIQIGDIPDEDIAKLEVEDNDTLPISEYEIGLQYVADLGRFETENDCYTYFANTEGKSVSTIRRLANLGKLPEWLVSCFKTPNDIPKSKINWVVKVLEDKEKVDKLKKAAEAIKDENQTMFDGQGELLTSVTILKRLKESVTEVKPLSRKHSRSLINMKGDKIGTYRVTGKGSHVFELDEGISNEKVSNILKFLDEIMS